MTAVIQVAADQWDKAAGRRIRQKRLDFVLASPKTLHTIAVIELDDLTHQLEHCKKRDRFIEQVFEDAGVLLIRIRVYKKYDPKRIRSIVNANLRSHRAAMKAINS